MKKHYWLRAKDQRDKNEGFYLACKATWRNYNSEYTKKKENVTCLKCIKSIKRNDFK